MTVPSLLAEAGNPPLDLPMEEQCLIYLARLERNQQYAKEFDVLKDHCYSDFTEDGKFMAQLDTRAIILKQRQNLHSNPILNQIPEKSPWLLNAINICREGVIAGNQNNLTT